MRERKKRKQPNAADRIEVGESNVHGRGVYATKAICKGARIIEYAGKRMRWDQASDDGDDTHTFLFGVEDGDEVINAGIGGNESRWINHSCDPNCEAVEEDGRVFIYALRQIHPGEELFYDYSLQIDEPRTPETEKEFACHCRDWELPRHIARAAGLVRCGHG